MPLKHGKSQKSFEHNIKAEMHAGKPQDQALAIAYNVKRQSGKKKKAAGGSVQSGSKDMNMAKGGMINESAHSEVRPSPQERDKDAHQIARNSGNKPAKHDHALDKITVQQAQSNNGRQVKPIKHPRMVPSSAFSTKLRDQEDHLQELPSQDRKEEGPDRHGPQVRDMQDEHSTHRKPYAKGGEIEESDYSARPNKYMDDLLDLPPSHDEGQMMAEEHDEEGEDRQGPEVRDMEHQHNSGRKAYAEGGHIQYDDAMDYDHDMELNPAHDHHSADDSEEQPEDEADMDREDSIAAAIMAKKERHAAAMSDSDIDEMQHLYGGGMYAEGGKINGHDSIYAHPDEDQADLRRNAEEDANMEDQSSFDALRKENYSESEGLHQLDSPMDSAQHGDEEEMDSHDQHDMADKIHRKMMARRQFKQR